MNRNYAREYIQMTNEHMKKCLALLFIVITVQSHYPLGTYKSKVPWYHLTPIRMLLSETDSMEKSEPWRTTGGNVKWCTTVKDSMAVPKNNNNRIIIWYSNSNSGSIPKRIESGNLKRYLYTHVHSHIIRLSKDVGRNSRQMRNG